MTPTAKQWMLRREATLSLAIATLAIRILPPQRLLAWANVPPRQVQRFSGHEIPWITWALNDVGSQATCLPRAIAAQYMLRRRGIISKLCLGVARGQNALQAHAWIEIGTKTVFGGSAGRDFAKVAEFGGS